MPSWLCSNTVDVPCNWVWTTVAGVRGPRRHSYCEPQATLQQHFAVYKVANPTEWANRGWSKWYSRVVHKMFSWYAWLVIQLHNLHLQSSKGSWEHRTHHRSLLDVQMHHRRLYFHELLGSAVDVLDRVGQAWSVWYNVQSFINFRPNFSALPAPF